MQDDQKNSSATGKRQKHSEDDKAAKKTVVEQLAGVMDKLGIGDKRAAVVVSRRPSSIDPGVDRRGAVVVSLTKLVVKPNRCYVGWCARCLCFLNNRHDVGRCLNSLPRTCYNCRRPGHPSAVCPFLKFAKTVPDAAIVCSTCLMLGHKTRDMACGTNSAYAKHVKTLERCGGGLLSTSAEPKPFQCVGEFITFHPIKYFSCQRCDHVFLRGASDGMAIYCPFCGDKAAVSQVSGKLTW